MEKKELLEIFKAIDKDDVEKVKELVVNATQFTANTLLCYAAENNAVNTLKFFLAAPGVDPTIADNYAIRVAEAKGYTECVNLLGADSRVDKSVLEDESLKVKTLESKIEEMLAGNVDVAEKVNEVPVADAGEELPEVEEDLEEVEEIDEAKEEAIVEEILEELDQKEDNKNTEEVKESKEFGRKIVIDREMTAGIFESLGVKKNTKEEEEEIFSDVEKNLQKTVESTVNEANE